MEHKWNAGVFRKSYGEIGTIRSCLGPDVPCLALTATATRQTRLDIYNILGMNNSKMVVKDANKPNVRYSVLKVSDNSRKTFQWLVDEIACHGINTD